MKPTTLIPPALLQLPVRSPLERAMNMLTGGPKPLLPQESPVSPLDDVLRVMRNNPVTTSSLSSPSSPVTSSTAAAQRLMASLPLFNVLDISRSRPVTVDDNIPDIGYESPEVIAMLRRLATAEAATIIDNLPERYASLSKIDKLSFNEDVTRYMKLYYQAKDTGCLWVIEALTAVFDIYGAMALFPRNDNEIMALYALRALDYKSDINDDECLFTCSVTDFRTPAREALFATPRIEFTESRATYDYRRADDGTTYWERTDYGIIDLGTNSHWFILNRQSLSTKEMWHEITTAESKGYQLCDEDDEPLSRSELVKKFRPSSL